MWYKINKFLTMVYPQYTAGRQLSSGNSSFYQPFSQIPGASPMIRMRVGDLIKSNYSTFGMGRLFGLAQLGQFNISGETQQQQQASQQEQTASAERIQQVTQRMQSGNFARGEKFILNWGPSRPSTGPFFCLPFPGAAPSEVTPYDIALTISENTANVEVIGIYQEESDGKWYTLKVAEPEAPDLANHPGLKLDFFFVVKLITTDSPTGPSPIKWSSSTLSSEIIRVANQSGNPTATTSPETLTQTQAFLSTTNNPILRAFETTRGDGMAGFISSIRMDWMMGDGLWETVGYGNRAPKMCKISIQFKPIFDLPPGLDSNGFMNAPVYPVGESSNAMIIDTETGNTTQDKINSFNEYKKISARNISAPTAEPTTRENAVIPGLGRSGIRLFGRRIV
jgi:hypothetical protein